MDRYDIKCDGCANWKYGCLKLAPGDINQVKYCEIYLVHKNQTTKNWQVLGCTNRTV